MSFKFAKIYCPRICVDFYTYLILDFFFHFSTFFAGESILISSYSGKFSEALLEQSHSIVMLAAGTGITPMIRIIYWVLTAKDIKRFLFVLYNVNCT